MANPEILRALNLHHGEIVPGNILEILPSAEATISRIRSEVQHIPDIHYFMHFAPSYEIIPITKPGITYHRREHGAHIGAGLTIKLLWEQAKGTQIPWQFLEAGGFAGALHDARRTNDETDWDHGNIIAYEIENDKTGITKVPKHLRKLVCRVIREHVPEDTHKMHALTVHFKAIDSIFWWRTGDFRAGYFRDMTAVEMLPLVPIILKQTEIELHSEKDGYIAGLKAMARIGLINW